MKKIHYFLSAVGIVAFGCSTPKQAAVSPQNPIAQTIADSIRKIYAPDKRVALFDVNANGNVLAGETNMPEAKAALVTALQQAKVNYVDSVQVLPDASLAGNLNAVVSISVANIRVKAGHGNEMATQATLGTPLKVYRKEKGWYLVQTPDKYIGWTEGGGIKTMNTAAFSQWEGAQKVIYTKPYGFGYTTANTESQTVSDLVYGHVMAIKQQATGFYEVTFPDGREAFVPTGDVMLYKDWAASRKPTQENLVMASKKLMGVPYLWGGTSFKGVDCSGFTRTVYFMNGLVLPRDASQQALVGQDVDTKSGWQNLQPGDLLFFGGPSRDGKPAKVTHVGMWLGGPNNEFIQSSSRVQISSFNPSATNYDGGEHHRFIKAKRITPKDALFDLSVASFY